MLKEMRKKLGYSQEKLSKEIGLCTRSLQYYEAGKRKTPKYIFLLLEYMLKEKEK